MPPKGHNYGICRVCGLNHGPHPLKGKKFKQKHPNAWFKGHNGAGSNHDIPCRKCGQLHLGFNWQGGVQSPKNVAQQIFGSEARTLNKTIHHIDGNQWHNVRWNIEFLTYHEHRLEHERRYKLIRKYLNLKYTDPRIEYFHPLGHVRLYSIVLFYIFKVRNFGKIKEL